MDLDKTAEPYRHRLVAQLVAEGRISSPKWRKAFAAVPRHVFVPHFLDLTDSGLWWPVTVETTDEMTWLEQVYADRTCVTQLNGTTTAADARAAVEGGPTSSSTEPGLMVAMLEALEIDDGMTVVEIGTGTGYNSALLCERLGSEQVRSVEVDPALSAQAAERLRRLGYEPELIVGDGADLVGAEVDRLIATCSFPTIPAAWLDLVKPGGLIIATIYCKPHGMAIAKLRLDPRGVEGEFILPGASFMEARTPPRGPVWGPHPDDITAASARPTRWVPSDLGKFPVGFLAGWVLGDASHYLADDETPDMVVDHASRSWAAFGQGDDEHSVKEGGTRRIWQAVEQILAAWQRGGASDLSGFRYEVVAGRDGYDALASRADGVKWRRFNESRRVIQK